MAEPMNRRKLGSRYEQIAAEWMHQQGFVLLEHSFRCRLGEIDLIALEGNILVFTEVKYRRNAKLGRPEEAVDLRKQKRIMMAAAVYLQKHPEYIGAVCRFDVAAVLGNELRYIRHAFEGI